MSNLQKNWDSSSEAPPLASAAIQGGSGEAWENPESDDAAFIFGHVLFQDSYFFCKFKPFGNLPEPGNIFVETVVDSDSGIAFAKVYPDRSAMNAVDILATRITPFYQRLGIQVKEIHTRHTSEYCGLLPKHAYETYLVTSHIRHQTVDLSSYPYSDFCGRFYLLLKKKFLQPSLRGKFLISLTELQRELDAFLDDYNAEK